MLFRFAYRFIFFLSFMSLGASAMSGVSHQQLKDLIRQRKKEHFFINLCKGAYVTGINAYCNADEQDHVQPALHTAAQIAEHVCDVSVTELAEKMFNKYTPAKLLKKKSLTVGPLIFSGKQVTKSLFNNAKVGIINAAYLRKKYGTLWPLYFGKNYCMPMILKAVVLGAIMPPLFHALGADHLQNWGNTSLLKHELASFVFDGASSCISRVYDWCMPRFLLAH